MSVRCDIPSYTNPSKKPAARYQLHLARLDPGRSAEGGAELCSGGQDSGERAGEASAGLSRPRWLVEPQRELGAGPSAWGLGTRRV